MSSSSWNRKIYTMKYAMFLLGVMVCLVGMCSGFEDDINWDSARKGGVWSRRRSTVLSAVKERRELSRILDVRNLPVVEVTSIPEEKNMDSSYKRTWTCDDWDRHGGYGYSIRRYTRHILYWYKSSVGASVLPTVGLALVWTALLAHVLLPHTNTSILAKGCQSATTFLLAPILLLLTLRTNRALDRVLEARRAWGRISRSIKSLTSLLLTNHHPHQYTIIRYLALFAWTCKASLHGNDDTPVIQSLLSPMELQWFDSCPETYSKSWRILIRIRYLLNENTTKQHHVPYRLMEERLSELEQAIGTCQRIFGSPIPPTYTRHTSRLLVLFIAIIPISFMIHTNDNNDSWTMYITTAIVSFVLVGIDEIGVRIEHPFPLLPLQQVCLGIQRDIHNMILSHITMP